MTNPICTAPQSLAPQMPASQPEITSPKLVEARRRLPLNLLSNLTWLVINMVTGLWYTPYLIAQLGVAVFGLVPLANSVTNYFAILTDGYNSAVNRFLQIELGRDDTRGANRVFNTSITGAGTILALIVPTGIVVSWLAPKIFHLPAGYERDLQWLVLLTILAFGLTFFSSSFAVSSFATHRFDLRLGLNVVRLTVQMGTVVLLFALLAPNVWQVGLGIFLSALVYLAGHYRLSRRLTPQLRIKPSLFDGVQLKQMLRFSGWVLVNQAGAQLFLNIDLIVANLVFGAFVGGRYGAVIVFSGLLRALVGTIDAVLNPIVLTLYSQNNLSGLARFSSLSVKFVGLMIGLPIGLICGLAKPLLTLWLGPEYADLSWLLVILVCHLCINLAVIPLFSVQVATNHVRVPGILTLIMGIANACLAVALALWSGLGYLGIALAGATVLTAKNGLFTPIYNARILGLPWWRFLKDLLATTFATLLVSGVTYRISTSRQLTTWAQLALVGAMIGSLYLVAAYFLAINPQERALIQFEFRRRLGRPS